MIEVRAVPEAGRVGHAAGFRSMVVALDLSADGDRALPIVHALSQLTDIPVELLTVSSPLIDDSVDAYELSRRAAANGWPEHSYTIIHDNEPARAIADHLAERPRALLVMATSAKQPIAGQFLGSVSEEVLSLVKQPVLLVGPRVPGEFRTNAPTLVVGVDESGVAEASVPAIANWMHTFGGTQPWLTEVLSSSAVPADDHSASMQRLTTALGIHGITASWEVLHGGDPEVQLEHFAERLHDPVFVATSVRWTDGRLHWHSTTRRLVQHATRPVLVVPAEYAEAVEPSPEHLAEPANDTEWLTPEQCWALLRSARVGRLATCSDGVALIFPVNFVVDGATVVFRTAAGTKLAACRDNEVAFEIDDLDERSQIASSVIIAGRAIEITDADDWDRALELPLFPWNTAPKGHFVRIVPESLSGRRFRAVYADSGRRHIPR